MLTGPKCRTTSVFKWLIIQTSQRRLIKRGGAGLASCPNLELKAFTLFASMDLARFVGPVKRGLDFQITALANGIAVSAGLEMALI